MNLFPIILLATTLTTSNMVAAGTIAGTIAALTGALANNHDECSRIHPRVLNAIDTFCKKTDIVIPSWYGNAGAVDKDDVFWVGITGKCKPAQWVPQKYCKSQFYDMCAHADKNGESTRHYGNGKCQEWGIYRN